MKIIYFCYGSNCGWALGRDIPRKGEGLPLPSVREPRGGETRIPALAGVAKWVEHRPTN